MTRPVEIKKRNNTWFVTYLDRQDNGHYCAAQFYASDWSKDKVIEWVKNNPKLELR